MSVHKPAAGVSRAVKKPSDSGEKVDASERLEEEAEMAITKLLNRRKSTAALHPLVRRRYANLHFDEVAVQLMGGRSLRFKNAARQALEMERFNLAKKRLMFPLLHGAEQNEEKEEVEEEEEEAPPTPRRFLTLRRAARSILMVIKVCIAVRELLSKKVKGERWMLVMDNILINASRDRNKRQVFRGMYMDDNSHDFHEVSFDYNIYRRDFVARQGSSARARAALEKVPGIRSEEEIDEILTYLQGLILQFRTYPVEVQRRMVEVAFFDKFADNRVIIQQGAHPDGFYFVITGTVAEHSTERRDPRLYTSGSKFGEQDLICGCPRRSTAVTKSYVELLYIHRLDYGNIFNLCNPTATVEEVSGYMQHPVFSQFPVHKLIENPGTWNIMSFKVNQLIAEDSNTVDWIYVVIQGEARVLRTMETRYVEIARQEHHPGSEQVNRLLNFESGGHSVPRAASTIHRLLTAKSAVLPSKPRISPEDDEARIRDIVSRSSRFPVTLSRPKTSPGYMSTRPSNTVRVPPFLQLEQIGVGKTFGLRACLEEEEQGASCSLVSAGCTMLLINRRYVMILVSNWTVSWFIGSC